MEVADYWRRTPRMWRTQTQPRIGSGKSPPCERGRLQQPLLLVWPEMSPLRRGSWSEPPASAGEGREGVSDHRVTAMWLAFQSGCATCGPDERGLLHMNPHNIVFLCSCGKSATGRADHIWKVTNQDGHDLTLSPSVNWLNDPKNPAAGSHLHSFVTARAVPSIGDLFARPPATKEETA